MPFELRAQIDGLKETLEALHRLPDVAAGPAVASAVRDAAQIILDAARARVQRRTGLLAESLGVGVKLYPKFGSVVATIGPRSGFRRTIGTTKTGRPKIINPLYYAHLVEKGTRPHGYKTRGGTHPGARAYPFLGPALAATESSVVAAIAAAVADALQKVGG